MKLCKLSALSTLVTMALAVGSAGSASAALCGDVNNDGSHSVSDGVNVLRLAAALPVTSPCGGAGAMECADITGDLAIGVSDGVRALRIAAQLDPVPTTACPAGEGFGRLAAGDGLRPSFRVTNLGDSAGVAGTLRDALQKSRNAGGYITFGVSGVINVGSVGLEVPANTTINAAGASITLDGSAVVNQGVLNIWSSNVYVRGLRIRNAGRTVANTSGRADGIQIVPKNGASISNITIDNVSVTNSDDGGIDITGCIGLGSVCNNASWTVSNVTLSDNYLAGNGTDGTDEQTSGGGATLIKYGVTNVSLAGNFWDKNLRRNPIVDGEGYTNLSLVDMRYNYVRTPNDNGWTRVEDTAKLNLVTNTYSGTGTYLVISSGGLAHTAGNTPSSINSQGNSGAFSIPAADAVTARTSTQVFNGAGAAPRDTADTYYVNTATTYAAVRSNPYP